MRIADPEFPASSISFGSRKPRIAMGAGVPLPEVNRLLKQFDHMQKTMKKLVKGGMLKNMMRGMGGRLPPGFGP